jgi:hypothetical protein
MINLANQADRLLVIREIDNPENKARKAQSLRQYEIFNDRQTQYVLEYLRGQFSESTVKEMPIISSINLARRIVKQEASLYKTPPKRTFINCSPEQSTMLEALYSWGAYNDRFMRANEFFKLQSQTHIQWVLKDQQIKARALLPHHLDVIPYSEDPEQGAIYIISSFDKQTYMDPNTPSATGYRGISQPLVGPDGYNQKIADPDDYKKTLKRYVVWSKEFNFIMDADGKIVSGEDITNPLGGIIPIVDASSSKDFEYWVRMGQSVSDFSVQFNGMISDVANVVRLQGWGQAVFSGPEGILPEALQIGPNHVLRLPKDPNNPVDTKFEYVTPNADIQGSLEFLKMNLSMFMSSRGIDPKTVSTDGTSQSFTSGLERLLAMVTKFEASKEDISVFSKAEKDSFQVIKAYLNNYEGTEMLDDDWTQVPEESDLLIQYEEPQMIQSEKEKLELIQMKREVGLQSRVAAYMQFHEVDEETAIKELAEIDNEGQGANAL